MPRREQQQCTLFFMPVRTGQTYPTCLQWVCCHGNSSTEPFMPSHWGRYIYIGLVYWTNICYSILIMVNAPQQSVYTSIKDLKENKKILGVNCVDKLTSPGGDLTLSLQQHLPWCAKSSLRKEELHRCEKAKPAFSFQHISFALRNFSWQHLMGWRGILQWAISKGGGSLCRCNLAYGVSHFSVTSGMLAKQGKRRFANHSPLSAPSGRIILLYVDELITVPSIWLLYIKKNQLLTLCQQAPEGLPLYIASVLLFKDKLLA